MRKKTRTCGDKETMKTITIPLSFFIRANKQRLKYCYTPKDQEYIDNGTISKINHYGDKIEIAINHGYESYLDFVKALYESGNTYVEIAKIAGMNSTNVGKILHRLKVKIRKS